MEGQIVKLMMGKGFGFIRGEDKKEYFFHHSALVERAIKFEALREGQPVQFSPSRSEKGLRAEDVILQL